MAENSPTSTQSLNDNLSALRTRADHADEAIVKLEGRSIQLESKMDAGFARIMTKIEEQADKSKFPTLQVTAIVISSMVGIAGLILTFAALYLSSYTETQNEHKTSIKELKDKDSSLIQTIQKTEDQLEDDYQEAFDHLESRMNEHHLMNGHGSGMGHIEVIDEELDKVQLRLEKMDDRVDRIEKSRFDNVRGTEVENRINQLSERVATLEVVIDKDT